MSLSIYYSAKRDLPLTQTERAEVDRLMAKYSIRDQVERFVQTGHGHNGMDFHVYDPEQPTEADVLFEGATQLPTNDGNMVWDLVQYWCCLLSEVRRAVPNASWHVHVNDHDIQWNAAQRSFDPTE